MGPAAEGWLVMDGVRVLVGGALGGCSAVIGAIVLGSVGGACLLGGFTLGAWFLGMVLAG